MLDLKNLISARLAGNILIGFSFLFLIFHGLALIGLVPAELVWGGQTAEEPSSLQYLEIFAVVINIIFLVVVAAKVGYIRAHNLIRFINICLWIILVYLFMSVGSNLVSMRSAENLVFTPVIALLALLIYRLLLEE